MSPARGQVSHVWQRVITFCAPFVLLIRPTYSVGGGDDDDDDDDHLLLLSRQG